MICDRCGLPIVQGRVVRRSDGTVLHVSCVSRKPKPDVADTPCSVDCPLCGNTAGHACKGVRSFRRVCGPRYAAWRAFLDRSPLR